MTVAEIKEYIDNSIQESEQVGMSGYDSALLLKNSMRTIKSMLDELPRDYAQETINDMEKVLDNAWKKVLGE